MKVEIRCQPAYAIAYCFLAAGETIHVERDAMAFMSGGFDIGGGLGGTGVGKALVRKAFGQENIIFGHYTASVHDAWIALTPKFPGDIAEIFLDGAGYLLEQGAVMAYTDGVKLDTTYSGMSNVLLREGISMLHVGGRGEVLASSYGAIVPVDLAPGEQIIVDSGHIVGYSDHMDVDIRMLGGASGSVLTGEGLVGVMTGPGRVFIQTRAEQGLRSWLFPERKQN